MAGATCQVKAFTRQGPSDELGEADHSTVAKSLARRFAARRVIELEFRVFHATFFLPASKVHCSRYSVEKAANGRICFAGGAYLPAKNSLVARTLHALN